MNPKSSDETGMGSTQAIVATGLTKWFGEGETKLTAVNQVGLIAHFGEMLFIVGPSGSGKTTLLSMISGILRPNIGSVSVSGTKIWAMNNDQFADFRLNSVGFVFQNYYYFPRLTTAKNVAIPLILEKLGALKAIGAKGRELVYLIQFMATSTALTGYGLGVGLVTIMISLAKYRYPNDAAMITLWNLGLAFGMVLLIAGSSSYSGDRKVLKVEPFDIFRR